MLKTGILHPQLARVMAELRHMDMLVIADAGLPIPKGVERVDLGWKL
jgi:D-ribose pyranase